MLRILLSACALFLFSSGFGQLAINAASAAAVSDNILRYDIWVETNESAMAYVEWNRLSGEDIVESYHSNLAGPSTELNWRLIGFVANTTYQWRVVTWDNGACVSSDWQTFTTGALPSDVQTITNLYVNSDQVEGYLMTNAVSTADKTIQMFNRDGEVVWYEWHAGVDGYGQQQNCEMWDITDEGNTLTLECHRLQERDLFGNVLADVDFTGTEYESKFFHHDVIKNSAGNYVAIAAETRTYDFTSNGGSENTVVIGEGLMEFDATGNVLWEWWSLDYFDPVALNVSNQNAFFTPIFGANAFNWQHCNSVHQDYDGNYLISFKEVNQLYKVDAVTGEILFSVSGNNPSVPLQNDAGFAEQHDFNTDHLEMDKYMVFDNLGDGIHSRLVEFAISYYEAPTAYKTWEYVIGDSIASPILGTSRKLPNGNRLGVCGAPGANFANKGHIIEVNDDGELLWHAKQSSWIYRAYYYPELWAEQSLSVPLPPAYVCLNTSLNLDNGSNVYWYGEYVEEGVFTPPFAGNFDLHYKYGWLEGEIVINVPDPLELNIETSSVACFGECNGTVDAGQNDKISYEIIWNDVDPDAACAGNYTLTTIDTYGCEMTHTYMVDGPDALLCEIITTNEVEGDDGSVCVEVEGGTPDYEIQWSTGNNTECVYDLSDGEYIVTVIDENGCTCASTGVVYVGTDEWTAPQILVTPNPVMDQLTITGLTGTATSIDLLDMTGRKIRSLTNVQNGTINVDDLAAGKYALVIKHIERAPDVVTFVKR